MKDIVNRDIGADEPSQDWVDIDWRLIERRVKNLRQRIFRATKQCQWNKVRSLMKLMLRSYSNLLSGVRKVTQENKGRKTPGVDRQLVLTPKARAKLVRQMLDIKAWVARPGKRVYITKAGGKQRPLGILTVKNRVAQAIVKNALEPSWEARFEPNSYGFRPGRGCHDAIVQCWIRLNRITTHKLVLVADVRAAFDQINHDFVLKRLGNMPGRELIKQWLKAGYVDVEIFHATTTGVQQGGAISPLLANVALDGLECVLPGRAGYIRYADDLVVTAKSREEIEALIPTIEAFLAERGLELNTEKTRMVHVRDGFNFLGFNVRSYNGKCLVRPQKEKVQICLKAIRAWLKTVKSIPPAAIISHLNPIIRGKMAANFSLFRERLQKLGLGTAEIIAPPGYCDFTYYDNSYYSCASYSLLELEIHKVLWPDTPFQFEEFSIRADQTKPNWQWKWKNRKCDTLAFMGHVLAGSGLFVSDDRIFHGDKKAELLKFAGGDIAKPMQAVARLNDQTPFTEMPAAVAHFIAHPTDQIDPTKVPTEFERIQAVKKINDSFTAQ